MQKELPKMVVPETDQFMAVIDIVKREERKGRALAVSIRLEALATHITNRGLNGIEAAELLRREATRYENESQELH
ncbi:corresponds to STY3665 from Accession AL513382: Salmonella typhi CT18 [Enterobacter hormaechei]|nr:corresponds to STY3665 from Accession AL513382: Salmonella typhi CT18 [Enterobacter hormaechei]